MSTASTRPCIDVHHHILPPVYERTLGTRLGTQGLFGSASWSVGDSLASMDRNEIAVAITSISAPGFWFGDARETAELVRACNEFAAAMCQDHPSRFGLFASLPMPDVDATLREIDHAAANLRADGFAMLTHYDGLYLGHPSFEPVFAELNRRKAVVFLHPTKPPYGQPNEIPLPTLEFPFETTRTVTSLLYNGVLTRYRDMRLICPHGGGTLPFLAARIGRLARNPDFRARVPDGVVAELSRLLFDTAISTNPFIFSSLLQLTTYRNVLFGSDYPHAGEGAMAASVTDLGTLGLAPAEVDAIRGVNAAALFPRFA